MTGAAAQMTRLEIAAQVMAEHEWNIEWMAASLAGITPEYVEAFEIAVRTRDYRNLPQLPNVPVPKKWRA